MSPFTFKVALLIMLAAIPASTGMSAYYYGLQITQLKNQLTTLGDKVDMLNATITSIQLEITQNSNLDSQQINSLNAQLSQLQSQVNQLTGLDAQRSAQVATLQTQVASLQAKIALLQQALSENLVIDNPGAVNITSAGSFIGAGNSFNILVSNSGGTSVSITSIHINNLSPTGSNNCYGSSAPCVVNPTPSSTAYSFTGGNITVTAIGQIQYISVQGISVGDGSGYRVTLTSATGRSYSFFYPWPMTISGSGQGPFQANAGPLKVYLDFDSFNFTWQSQTVSQPAWVLPEQNPVVIWIKVSNAATNSPITIRETSSLLMEPYSTGGLGNLVTFFVSDSGTLNPTSVVAYNWQTNPYTLPAATASSLSPPSIIKFGSPNIGVACFSTNCVGFPNKDGPWVVFIGFYYMYKGAGCSPLSPGYDPTFGCLQGQTIPFAAAKTCAAYPAASCY